jgi:hypothetical protein
MNTVIEFNAEKSHGKSPIEMTPKGMRKPVKVFSIARPRFKRLVMPPPQVTEAKSLDQWPFCLA